jgi:nitrogenase molybdenum-iron protein NifN
MRSSAPNYVSTRNACKLCSPLGAAFVFRGIEGAVPFLHGSQGCATYIRRYLIGHFREPVDIASSSFGESSAIFGGQANLVAGLQNVMRQYHPQLIGVATTCLSETIGDDVPMFLREFVETIPDSHELPRLVHVSTPSYEGTHMSGYRAAVRAVVDDIAGEKPVANLGAELVNVIPPLVSPADLRLLRELFRSFGLQPLLLPDYADTLDGGTWDSFELIPGGGTAVEEIESMGNARATIELGCDTGAGALLQERFGVEDISLRTPVGVRATDELLALLERMSGCGVTPELIGERSRLLDAYVDAHKIVARRRVVLYGEVDLVAAIAGFIHEIGALPIICATGERTGELRQRLEQAMGEIPSETQVVEGVDFLGLEALVSDRDPELLVGNSKGYPLASKLGIPLVRVGFPVHDRFGGARLLHLGYRGALALFDRLVNTILEARQAASPVGYMFM